MMAIYILPPYRKSRDGLALYKAFKKWAKDNDLIPFYETNSGIDIDRKAELYKRLGGKQIGVTYMDVKEK